MSISNAHRAKDIVMTCYICDDQYTGDLIESHLEECKYDWNLEEIDKPINERIPLPKPTSEFIKMLNLAKQLNTNKSVGSDAESADQQHGDEDTNQDEGEEEENEEEEDEDEPNGSVIEEKKTTQLNRNESESNIENSLVPCPNCNRTFFPERLTNIFEPEFNF